MRRRSATTGSIVEVSRVLQGAVGVLSEPGRGAAIGALGTALRRVASCKTRATSLRSELVIVTLRLVEDTKLAMMSRGQ